MYIKIIKGTFSLWYILFKNPFVALNVKNVVSRFLKLNQVFNFFKSVLSAFDQHVNKKEGNLRDES